MCAETKVRRLQATAAAGRVWERVRERESDNTSQSRAIMTTSVVLSSFPSFALSPLFLTSTAFRLTGHCSTRDRDSLTHDRSSHRECIRSSLLPTQTDLPFYVLMPYHHSYYFHETCTHCLLFPCFAVSYCRLTCCTWHTNNDDDGGGQWRFPVERVGVGHSTSEA